MTKPLLLLLAALLAPAAPASAQSWEKLAGQDSSISAPRKVEVRGQAQWDALWAEHRAGRPEAQPAVDFSKEMIVALFLGDRGAPGWTVPAAAMRDPLDAERLVVLYSVRPPASGSSFAEAGSRPYLILKVPLARTVAFEEEADFQAYRPNGPLASRGKERELQASQSRLKSFFDGEWYMSWGYNKETWAPMDIRVRQPSLGNDFVIHDMKGHDEPGWEEDLLKKGITIPQYQFIVGRFVDKKRTLAVELNWDHTKYSSTLGQTARVSGVIDGKPVDEQKVLDREFFNYKLHNGANHVMVNVVKRLPLINQPSQRFSVSGIAKAGAGIMLPHAENTVMGQELDLGEKALGNYVGKHHGWWQVDGWTAGLEAGVRVAVRPFYVEFTDKVAYARMSDIPVYQGTAEHDLWMNELTLSLGVTINGGRKVGRR